jgi:hypothetical protein
MKLTPWYLVAIAPIAVAGCSGAFLGHCAVLAVTLCIFVGTLTLGRQTVSASAGSVGVTPAALGDVSAIGPAIAAAPLASGEGKGAHEG